MLFDLGGCWFGGWVFEVVHGWVRWGVGWVGWVGSGDLFLTRMNAGGDLPITNGARQTIGTQVVAA